ncbi:Hypothetical protein Cp3995_0486 [Corynebacterium pseudotuberculosis 3/99-5]|nr:Hypothetical protein Cp3995_0486 [Corynebacterium pseudotuberculosis 3/99-5]
MQEVGNYIKRNALDDIVEGSSIPVPHHYNMIKNSYGGHIVMIKALTSIHRVV